MTSSVRFSPVFVLESEGLNFVSNAPGYFTHIDAFISLQTDPLYTGITDPLYTGITDPLYTGITDPLYTGITDPLYTGITDPLYTGITDPVYTGITDPVSSEYSAINPKKQSDCMPPRM